MEDRFRTNVRRLRTMNDLCLAQYVGSEILEEIIVSADNCPVFVQSISMIRKLPLQILPDSKLDLICDIFGDIKSTIKTVKSSYGADDILPILEFILIRGMVQNIGIEIRIIKDFLHPDIQGGEKGLLYCHFYTAYKSLCK